MSFNICCKSSCEILHAHPLSVLQDVNDQPSGKPIEVGSKLTDWDRGTTYGCGGSEDSDEEDMFFVDCGIIVFFLLSMFGPENLSLVLLVSF